MISVQIPIDKICIEKSIKSMLFEYGFFINESQVKSVTISGEHITVELNEKEEKQGPGLEF